MVELLTGRPLMPGKSNLQQLELTFRLLGRLSPRQIVCTQLNEATRHLCHEFPLQDETPCVFQQLRKRWGFAAAAAAAAAVAAAVSTVFTAVFSAAAAAAVATVIALHFNCHRAPHLFMRAVLVLSLITFL